MARGRPKKDKPEKVIQFTRSEFVEAIKSNVRMKHEAADYSRRASEHKGLFTARTGFSPKAFQILAAMWKMDDSLKAQDLMEEITMGFELLGFNDQGNLFDRVRERAERDVKSDGPKKESAGGEDERDLRPGFLRDAVPLDKAEKKFAEANKAAQDKNVVAMKDRPKKADKADASRVAPAGSPLADTTTH